MNANYESQNAMKMYNLFSFFSPSKNKEGFKIEKELYIFVTLWDSSMLIAALLKKFCVFFVTLRPADLNTNMYKCCTCCHLK